MATAESVCAQSTALAGCDNVMNKRMKEMFAMAGKPAPSSPEGPKKRKTAEGSLTPPEPWIDKVGGNEQQSTTY